MFRDIDEVFVELRFTVDEVQDLGDKLFATGTWRARGRESGAESSSAIAWVAEATGGKARRVRAFFDIDAAREAAGLPRSDSAAYANVELVRRVVAAGYRRPRPDFATLNALVHPEHEQIPFASRVEGGRLEGARGFREWLDSFENTFGSWTARTEDVRAIDGERVLVTGVFNAVGKRSGVPIEQHFALVMTVRDGKVRPTETFSSPEEALQTAARRD